MNAHETLRNVALLLQDDPRNYRKFGIWWWPVKALLKRLYTRDALYMLGAYSDPDGAARVPQLSLAETLAAACAEYQRNDAFGLGGDLVEDTEGEPYRIYDADVGVA